MKDEKRMDGNYDAASKRMDSGYKLLSRGYFDEATADYEGASSQYKNAKLPDPSYEPPKGEGFAQQSSDENSNWGCRSLREGDKKVI